VRRSHLRSLCCAHAGGLPLSQLRSVFYTGLSVDYIIAAVITLPLAAIGAIIVSYLGIFLAIFISPVAGVVVADASWRAVGRRRSRYLWLVVCGAIVAATVGVVLYQGGFLAGRGLLRAVGFRLDLILYVVMAVSAAYSRLRLG
jgi:hypothetical protein